MIRHLIIDFDCYIYRAITACKELIQIDKYKYVDGYNIKRGIKYLDDCINQLRNDLYATSYTLVVGDKDNFRKQLFPNYKSNRPEKPEIWYKLMQEVESCYELEHLKNLEGDDTCRIMYEDNNFFPDTEKIIVSVDKDFYSVPCKFYRDIPNRNNKKVETISVNDARKHLMKQIIMGDNIDGYEGIPKYGEVKADKFITDDTTADDVKKLYIDNGLTEDDYNRNRICATIIGIRDYDFKTGRVDTSGGDLL